MSTVAHGELRRQVRHLRRDRLTWCFPRISNDQDAATATVEVEAEARVGVIAFNYHYIFGCLNVLSREKEITLELQSYNQAGVFKSYDKINYLYLVMPSASSVPRMSITAAATELSVVQLPQLRQTAAPSSTRQPTVLVGPQRRGEDQSRRGAAAAHRTSSSFSASRLACRAAGRGWRGSRRAPRLDARGARRCSRWGSGWPRANARSRATGSAPTLPRVPRRACPSVLFCPDDLDMVEAVGVRAAASALDSFGVQLNAGYAKLLSAYERTVEQRNQPPRATRRASRDLLEVVGRVARPHRTPSCCMHRRALLERIRGHFVEVYRARSRRMRTPDVSLSVDAGRSWRDAAARRSRSSVLAGALLARREDELRRGMTLVGPHRDEVLFTIDGRSARDFGSQGQQRSIVLAWKIAEVQVTRDILGRVSAPVARRRDERARRRPPRRHHGASSPMRSRRSSPPRTSAISPTDMLARARVDPHRRMCNWGRGGEGEMTWAK
ncbi:MAG: hypothetical protein ACLTSX_04310 [Collinsella sp.]